MNVTDEDVADRPLLKSRSGRFQPSMSEGMTQHTNIHKKHVCWFTCHAIIRMTTIYYPPLVFLEVKVINERRWRNGLIPLGTNQP